MKRKKLPIGIQTFRQLCEEGCYYIDKTPFALRLIAEGKGFFLSRPRRFGKSLFLDMLAELFSGSRDLFVGLHAYDHWDWSRRYPVIRISFAEGGFRSLETFRNRVRELLRINFEAFGLQVPDVHQDCPSLFSELIRKVCTANGRRTVILVDEYDKPILDNLSQPELGRAIRDELRDLYSVIKAQDASIQFAFITGVSKFSKVSLFSGLNNLRDITLSRDYAAICGYTESDVLNVFAAELDGLDLETIRRWYNGYCWLGERVYNPFDLLLLFQERRFRPYWFETGTPTFLIDLLIQRRFFTPHLAEMRSDEALLSAFDIDHIATEALLWQTGYLTIVSSREVGVQTEYRLGYPNIEVESALNDALFKALLGNAAGASGAIGALYDMLIAADWPRLEQHLKSLFSGIPSDWYRKNDIDRYEGFYASVVYSHLAALGLRLVVEDASSEGRMDISVHLPRHIAIFEFKVVSDRPQKKALAQIRERNYAEKYMNTGLPIELIGIEFSRTLRNIVFMETERWHGPVSSV